MWVIIHISLQGKKLYAPPLLINELVGTVTEADLQSLEKKTWEQHNAN